MFFSVAEYESWAAWRQQGQILLSLPGSQLSPAQKEHPQGLGAVGHRWARTGLGGQSVFSLFFFLFLKVSSVKGDEDCLSWKTQFKIWHVSGFPSIDFKTGYISLRIISSCKVVHRKLDGFI